MRVRPKARPITHSEHSATRYHRKTDESDNSATRGRRGISEDNAPGRATTPGDPKCTGTLPTRLDPSLFVALVYCRKPNEPDGDGDRTPPGTRPRHDTTPGSTRVPKRDETVPDDISITIDYTNDTARAFAIMQNTPGRSRDHPPGGAAAANQHDTDRLSDYAGSVNAMLTAQPLRATCNNHNYCIKHLCTARQLSKESKDIRLFLHKSRSHPDAYSSR